MLTVESITRLAERYHIPLEDVLFITLNINGVNLAKATLRLPYPGNIRDVISVAEFFLNKSWEEIPDNIRKAVLAYLQRKEGVLRQIDGFLVVRRIQHQKKP